MIKRQDGRSMSVREAQTAMKPEIAAKAGNFGGVGPIIGRQERKSHQRPRKAVELPAYVGKPGGNQQVFL